MCEKCRRTSRLITRLTSKYLRRCENDCTRPEVKVRKMGDRVSIQFKDKYGGISPYLYSHWGGMSLVTAAKQFANTTRKDEDAGDALVNFIRSPLSKEFDDLHVEFADGGDNDDNGNIVVEIETGKSTRTPPPKPKKEPTKDEIQRVRNLAHDLIVTTTNNLDLMSKDLKKRLDSFESLDQV